MAKPTKKNATKPRPKMAKLVLTTWAACLARQKPVSTSAKPACMKMTRTAPMTTQSRLLSVLALVASATGSGASWATAGRAVSPTSAAPITPAIPSFSNRLRRGGDPSMCAP